MLPASDSKQASHVDQVGVIPIREVSGLALREHAGSEVLAVGDRDFELAVGKLRRGLVERFDVIDLRHALRRAGIEQQTASQWEAVKSDGCGRVFVLEENPGHVFVFDEAGERLVASIELAFRTIDLELLELQKVWNTNPNSRGEGIVLLDGGHVLVLKEKEPRRLIEFGPEDERPLGLRFLGRGAAFTLPRTPVSSMVPLRIWKFSKASKALFSDCSDIDVDPDGRLWIASDEGRVVGQVAHPRNGRGLNVASITRLPDKPKFTKPEGLALANCTHALIACDQSCRQTPLFSVHLNSV